MRVDNSDNSNALPHVDVVSKKHVMALVILRFVEEHRNWPTDTYCGQNKL